MQPESPNTYCFASNIKTFLADCNPKSYGRGTLTIYTQIYY